MSDNKNMKDGRDRAKVSGSEEYEVQYLAEKLKVDADTVRAAIKKVGNNREKVEAELQKGKGGR